jgi:hypothetical protein
VPSWLGHAMTSASPVSCTFAASSATSRSASARTPGSRRAVCSRWNTPATSARSRSCGSPSRSSRELEGIAHVLPVEVIADLLGLPETVRPMLRG